MLAACWSPPLPPSQLPLGEAPEFSARDGIQPDARWWHAFGDRDLDDHVGLALNSSFTLRAAFERLRAARALARQAEAPRKLSLDGVAGASLRDGDEISSQKEFRLGLEASYELDLWGRILAEAEAEELEARATAEDYQTLAVSLSAEIATTVYRLTETKAQLELIDSQLQVNRDVLQVLLYRFGIGQSGSADVLRQRQLVEATREQRLLEASAVQLLEHQLLMLQGKAPQQELDYPTPSSLPELPALPAVGLPADLVRRRPDVRAAYLRISAADMGVAAAIADRYPRIDLRASIETSAERVSDLFSSWIGSLVAQIVGPIVDGGERRREVERREAILRQRIAEYGDVVLLAFQDVEDALTLERRQEQLIQSLERQLGLANTTYTELRNQYLNGAADFLEVLTALRAKQGLERSILEARLLHVEARIALHRAIAGGFAQEMSELPARDAGEPSKPNEAQTETTRMDR
jgi:NodT family efflux transporter outer membrane factor (OMF) lipoprotein